MSRTTVFRTFVAAGSALAIVVAMSPLALAAGGNGNQGKSGGHGVSRGQDNSGSHGVSRGQGKKPANTAITKTTDQILKAIAVSPLANGKGKKFENDGNALGAQSRALAKKLTRLGSANPAIAVAVTTFIGSMDTATVTLQLAIKTARTTYKSALDAATTDAAKQSAKDAYTAAITVAHQVFSAAMQAATLALKTALSAPGASTPSPSTSPNPSPSTSTSPSPSPSPSTT